MIKDENRRHVSRHVSVELLAVLVELDGVQCLAIEIVVALQMRICVPDRVVWNPHFGQSKTIYHDDNWKGRDGRRREFELVTILSKEQEQEVFPAE